MKHLLAFLVDGTPMRPMRKQLLPLAKKVGLWNLAKDLNKGMKAL